MRLSLQSQDLFKKILIIFAIVGLFAVVGRFLIGGAAAPPEVYWLDVDLKKTNLTGEYNVSADYAHIYGAIVLADRSLSQLLTSNATKYKLKIRDIGYCYLMLYLWGMDPNWKINAYRSFLEYYDIENETNETAIDEAMNKALNSLIYATEISAKDIEDRMIYIDFTTKFSELQSKIYKIEYIGTMAKDPSKAKRIFIGLCIDLEPIYESGTPVVVNNTVRPGGGPFIHYVITYGIGLENKELAKPPAPKPVEVSPVVPVAIALGATAAYYVWKFYVRKGL